MVAMMSDNLALPISALLEESRASHGHLLGIYFSSLHLCLLLLFLFFPGKMASSSAANRESDDDEDFDKFLEGMFP